MSHPLRTSDILLSLKAVAADKLTLQDILLVLQDRAFALLVVLLGLPNCLPMPPPIPFICGLLLALVSMQIAVGRHAPWLPKSWLKRSVARTDVTKAVDKALPALLFLEKTSKPRMRLFEEPMMMRATGFILFAMALGLLVAAPIIGQIPLGLSVCLIGIGLVERDGYVVVAGMILGAFGLALSVSFVVALFFAADTLL